MKTKTDKPSLIPRLRFPEFQNNGEWEVRRLKDVSKIIMGSSPSSKSYNDKKIGLPLLQGNADIKNRLSAPRIYTAEITKECHINDILLSVRAPVGTVAKSVHNACIGRGIAAIRAIDKNSHEYLYQWLISNESAWQNISQGGTFDAVNSDEVRNLLLPIPLLPEQQKIADCLSSLDEVIAGERQKLEQLNAHKKGLLQNLFPQEGETVPKLRFPEFKDSGEWVEKKLGEIYEFKITNSFSRDMLNYEFGEIKNIHYGDIHTKFNTLFDIKKEIVPFINPDVCIDKIKEDSYCKEGDIIFADASEDLNDVGKSIEIFNLNGEKLVSGLHTLLARQKENFFIVGFAGFLFKSDWIRKQIQKEAQGAKVLGISTSRISNINIKFPKSKKEQQKIASCLSSLDDVIQAQQQKIEWLEQHKKGLLQGLFPNVNDGDNG